MDNEILGNSQESNETAEEVKSEAVTNENWYSTEYQELIESKGFKSADDVIKSYANLESKLGSSVKIPPADASDEAKKEFYDKVKHMEGIVWTGDENFYDRLGRPESPEGYVLEDKVNSELKEYVPTLDEELNDFKSIAHNIGLSNEQAQQLVEMRMKTIESQTAQLEHQKAEAQQQLKSMWGNEYENRLNAAKSVANIYKEKYGESVEELINGPAGNHPAFINMFSELAELYKEKGHEGMSQAQFGDTPETAREKIAEKRSDTGFMKAYNNSSHPDHKTAVNTMNKLYTLAYPD